MPNTDHSICDKAVSPLQNIEDSILKELQAIYESLKSSLYLKGPNCLMCGRCCNFKEYGHELWLTSLELTYLLLSEGYPDFEQLSVHSTCPYMLKGKCTAREGRVLGCRIFFCQLDKDEMELLHEEYFDKIVALHKKYNIQVEYGELLSSLNNLKNKE
ncbi:MAG: hypothetical protein JXR91_04335 [Deltaproteobacteria bacterium]|nr:hypothetical protein [Deltaproteobacteria bacterium]